MKGAIKGGINNTNPFIGLPPGYRLGRCCYRSAPILFTALDCFMSALSSYRLYAGPETKKGRARITLPGFFKKNDFRGCNLFFDVVKNIYSFSLITSF